MTSQTLREARKYEETVEKSIARGGTPGFSSVLAGWVDE